MKVNVCIVTFPLSEAGSTPLANLVKLFNRLANRVYVVSGGAALNTLKLDSNIRAMRVTHRVSSKILMRIINYVYTQLKISQYVITASRDANLFVFSIGGEGLIFPVLLLKLLKKKVLLMPGGVSVRVSFLKRDPLSKFESLLSITNFNLANRIVIYSPSLIEELNVNRGNKIIVAHRHFINFTKFVMTKKTNERSNIVGYIGRFGEEKGILNLIKSIPMVLKHRKDICFMLCGEGELSGDIWKIIQNGGLKAYVKLTGWVSHEEVPNFLNDLKLLVLPSYTEGLPNVMLEAMACGTPVLATRVGAIPDIIRDGETGFLLESNDPKHIADNIVELLNEPELLEKISKNAYEWVRVNFSYEKTLESWRRIFQELEIKN